MAVKSEPAAGHLRLSVLLGSKVEFHADRAHNPERIVFDLQRTQTAPGLNGAALTLNLGPVQRVRVATHDLTTTRLVIDTDQEVQYTANVATNPPRLEIDIPVREATASSPPAMIPRGPSPASAVKAAASIPAPAAPAKTAVPESSSAAPSAASPQPAAPASSKTQAAPRSVEKLSGPPPMTAVKPNP
ncbi:MAG: AMIN domain-containing protein, partial [Acidobacteriaceae bacterium]|nr:AMIN domain-containing protein [Acidobacteriaceae bacterium]